MKARRIKETRTFNPAWDAKKHHAAKRSGKAYEIPMLITFPVGTIQEGSDCVLQCCLPDPTMIPADEECHAAVVAFLTHPGRKKQMAKLKKMLIPQIFDKLPKGLQDYVKSVNAKWEGSTTAAVTKVKLTFLH